MFRQSLLASLAVIAVISHGCAAENSGTAKTADAVVEDANLAAVLVYADWCSSCKILDPKLTAARENEEFPGVSFVTIDYTDRDVAGLFEQADAKGIGPAIRAYLADEVFTGWLLLVDLDDNRVVGQVVKSMEPEEIAGAIKATQLAS